MSKAGLNLKYLRKLRGWTQEEFANKLNIKRQLLHAKKLEIALPGDTKLTSFEAPLPYDFETVLDKFSPC